MKTAAIVWLGILVFTTLFADFCGAITLDEISLMLRSGFSSETIVREELVGGRVYGSFDAAREKEFKKLNASAALIEALKSGKYAASKEEQLAWQKAVKQQTTAIEIERKRIAQQAAEQQPPAPRNTEIVVVPEQAPPISFKTPSEIEAEKKTAKAAEIAARKKYCEEHPIECETLRAAQSAREDAAQTQRELQSLKTSLWMQGVSPGP